MPIPLELPQNPRKERRLAKYESRANDALGEKSISSIQYRPRRPTRRPKRSPFTVPFVSFQHECELMDFSLALKQNESLEYFDDAEKAARFLAKTLLGKGHKSAVSILGELHAQARTSAFYDLVAGFGYIDLGEAEADISAALKRYSEDADPRLQDVAIEALDQIEFRKL